MAALGEALTQLKQRIVHCSICFNVSEDEQCRICRDPRRDPSVLCVVVCAITPWAIAGGAVGSVFLFVLMTSM